MHFRLQFSMFFIEFLSIGVLFGDPDGDHFGRYVRTCCIPFWMPFGDHLRCHLEVLLEVISGDHLRVYSGDILGNKRTPFDWELDLGGQAVRCISPVGGNVGGHFGDHLGVHLGGHWLTFGEVFDHDLEVISEADLSQKGTPFERELRFEIAVCCVLCR